MPTAQKLPPVAEQGRLIRDLRKLIELRGFATFVSAPLLEPRHQHFPDQWRPDALGVERLARRLLIYAGLAELDVDVELFTGEVKVDRIDVQGRATSWSHKGAAAWFAGFVEGRCQFGAAAHGLVAPDQLAGVMAHEVAHAYRHRHHLNTPDRAIEEPLTDLTTIYLGFGILTTNASYRYRAGGGLEGAFTRTQWSHDRLGYLSPQAMSFLLAVQVVARDLPAAERRRLAGLLEANQAAYFKTACDALDRDTLIEKLGLPPRDTWPPTATAAPRPFDTSADPPLPASAAPPRPKPYAGMPVFRITKTRAGAYSLLAVPIAAAGAIVLGVAEAPAWAWLGLPWLVLTAAWKIGQRRVRDICSEPECTAIIPDDAATCPGCGGVVSGRIRHANDRLEAREALEPPDDEDLEHDEDDAAEASSS